MKRMLKSAATFTMVLRGCLKQAWQDSDCQFHIPKSRFQDNGGEENVVETSPRREKAPAKNYFLGSFRDCVLAAWETADREYNIPKSRLIDTQFNQTAYRSSSKLGFVRRTGRFLSTLKHCISVSWEASDTFYNIPKSRYQNADFILELMKLAPSPKGKLVYRPFSIGRGVILGEATGRGWQVEPPDLVRKEVFIVPETVPGPGGEPELGR